MSSDWGQSWTTSQLPTSLWCMKVARQHDTLYAAMGNGLQYHSLVWSTDLGATWDVLRDFNSITSGVILLPLGSDLYTVGADTLWRWSPASGWDARGPFPTGAYHYADHGLAVIPGPNPLFVAYNDNGDTNLYLSTDTGHSWTQRSVDIPGWNQAENIQTMTWDPYRHRLWAATSVGVCYLDTFEVADASQPLVFKPLNHAVISAYPNPFNPSTTIRLDIPLRTDARLAVYDLTGRLVRTLFNGTVEAGERDFHWDGRDNSGHELSSGMYFCRLSSKQFTATHKLLLLR